ncbi:MAG: signal peptidase I [Coriobacteriales bacterium]|nr:signal peptidase I [Coriobacteriales bacterium]
MTERDESALNARVSASDRDKAGAGKAQTHQTSVGRWLVETALLILLAFLLAQGIKTFVVQPFVIPTGSMIPTIEIGNRVIAEKITYRFRDPKPGEIVVFDDPTHQNPQLIKRVIAVEGQTVDLKGGAIYVDGKKLDEPYVHGKPTDPIPGSSISFPLTVPKGEALMLGDNRPSSGDGRYFGPQKIEMIRGRALFTYWPVSQIGPLPTAAPGVAAQ